MGEEKRVLRLEVESIRPNPRQPRRLFDEGALRELAAGRRVVIVQFLKGGASGEIPLLESLGAKVLRGKAGSRFSFQMDERGRSWPSPGGVRRTGWGRRRTTAPRCAATGTPFTGASPPGRAWNFERESIKIRRGDGCPNAGFFLAARPCSPCWSTMAGEALNVKAYFYGP